MNVKYIGTALDYSGYGEAARHDISSLIAAGIGVTSTIPHYTLELADFGELGELVKTTQDRELAYDVVINHLTPNMYGSFYESGKYHIGRVFWETDMLPKEFADSIEKYANEVWTGSEYNKQAIIKAGVTRPVHVIPQAIEVGIEPTDIAPYVTSAEGTYKFYSMFEWTYRKNPLALLEAYWREFEGKEKVSLTIKTYLDNFTREKRGEVDQQITELKARLNLTHYAPLYLFRNLMDRSQVYRFHRSFDCFVSAHRGEGWGIPQMEAMLMNNPVISTNCGGIHEYLEDGIEALLIPYESIPLSFNNRNIQWYTSDQNWAEINMPSLREALRVSYENQIGCAIMGEDGGAKVRKAFHPASVGELMKIRLSDIHIPKFTT